LAVRRGAKGRRRKKKKRRTYLLFLRFFEIFRSDLRKYFCGVFGLIMQRNGQKRDKRKSMGKDERKKGFFPQLFRPKAFDMHFPQKVFYGVFELPLLRNAQKLGKNERGGGESQLFRPNVFDMYFPQKVFVVFLNSPC
jgi:hypothetical protein